MPDASRESSTLVRTKTARMASGRAGGSCVGSGTDLRQACLRAGYVSAGARANTVAMTSARRNGLRM